MLSRRCLWLVFVCVLGLPVLDELRAADDAFAAAVRETEPLSAEDEQRALRVPDGFRIQLFACEPEIPKPINMAFDARGRLWVSGSNDYPFPNLEHPGDSIRILEDTNGDGRADKVTVFVDGVTHPIGLLPARDGVVAFCIPNIVHFRDTNGDDRCDEQVKLYGPFDWSRDTHGLNNAFRRGYDGWVYACHGFSNNSTVRGADGHEVQMNSGNTYRFRLDGSRIEQFTWGQVNPFGMTFDRWGDLYTSDCHTKPIMLMIRQGQYPGFGRPHDGLGFCPPVMTHSHGSTAIAGVSQYTGAGFPDEYQNSLFVGNVMTSRVHRDTLQYSGSSVAAVEQPDFIVSEDPWFRPVDIQCGPDGALYVADFYNRIIGHYEVPLTHPGRDRERARIWRVSATSQTAESAAERRKNARNANVGELIDMLAHSHLGTRMHALDELTDRIGTEAVEPLRACARSSPLEHARVMALWGLVRLGVWDEHLALAGAAAESELVRVHAQRQLAEWPEWPASLATAAKYGLTDPSPLVQRAAADALARHAEAAATRELFQALESAPESDPHLKYGLKIALRNHLQAAGELERVLPLANHPEQLELLTTICLGLQTPTAANFLWERFRAGALRGGELVPAAQAIARQIAPEQIDGFIMEVQKRFAKDEEQQLTLLQSVKAGCQQQGLDALPRLQPWAETLATRLLAESSAGDHGWITLGAGASPWDIEQRSVEGRRGKAPFLSSLPGGEQAVSTLRSPTFKAPEKLEFAVCGHLGVPNEPADEKNFVRLCRAADDVELKRVLAPRNDQATRVSWQLSEQQGEDVYLEVVDGLALRSYGWIAIGEISPPVAPLPRFGAATAGKKLSQAANLVTEFQLRGLRPDLVVWLQDPRHDTASAKAVATAVARLDGGPRQATAAALVGHVALNPDQRARVLNILLAEDQAANAGDQLRDLIKELPTAVQLEAAGGLLTHQQGPELLMTWMEEGVISPRLLQLPLVRLRLSAASFTNAAARTETLFQSLPAPNAAREELLKSLKASFTESAGSALNGAAVFEKRCAVCHQLKGQGKIIGPQLDGIGGRGLDKLLEDVFDPNQNVDVAFRSRSYALADGRVLTGVFRRQEGNLVVIADNKGEELSFPESEIEEQTVSALSIMPDNWGEVLSQTESLDLLRFLLDQKR